MKKSVREASKELLEEYLAGVIKDDELKASIDSLQLKVTDESEESKEIKLILEDAGFLEKIRSIDKLIQGSGKDGELDVKVIDGAHTLFRGNKQVGSISVPGFKEAIIAHPQGTDPVVIAAHLMSPYREMIAIEAALKKAGN